MKIGSYNKPRLVRFTPNGAYLRDSGGKEVLLPNRYLTGEEEIGAMIEVFVYNDSEGRLVATTETPLAIVGDFVLMRVKSVNAVGAFLDWGLTAKDLLVPFREQRVRMQQGRSYIVHVYLDETSQRVVASAKLDKFLGNAVPEYKFRERVEVLVTQRTELGYKVIVDNLHWGLVYQKDLYQDLNIGERHLGFVRQVRPDGKIDVTLNKTEKHRVDDIADAVLAHLAENNGTMSVTDKSSPEDVMKAFSCSKKDFKKALGLLYKQRRIVVSDDKISLTK